MSKSVDDKLEEKRKQDHRQYRDELLEDFNCLFEDWKRHAEHTHRKWEREHRETTKEMEQIQKETKKIADSLDSIQRTTIWQIEKLKQGRTWKFYLLNILITIFGSFFTLLIAAKYWPQIRSLFM